MRSAWARAPNNGLVASLDSDETRTKLLEKPQNLTPRQRSANNDFARCINAMNLKNTFREIQTNRANVHLARLPSWWL
jgi:hypothetical protein